MNLLIAILFILFESIAEGLILKHFPALAKIVFITWNQILSLIILFAIYLVLTIPSGHHVWQLIVGYIFVRFMIFDITFNIAAGLPLFYYGEKKLYDRIMAQFGIWGWWLKFVLGVVGVSLLII